MFESVWHQQVKALDDSGIVLFVLGVHENSSSNSIYCLRAVGNPLAEHGHQFLFHVKAPQRDGGSLHESMQREAAGSTQPASYWC